MCFYPRHPRGWRLATVLSLSGTALRFYPRHPRGWRPALASILQESLKFLSTPPSRVATRCTQPCTLHFYVSIHATLAGGDAVQPFHNVLRADVSIHATLAGGDFLSQDCRAGLTGFYPRHPRGWRHTAEHRRAVRYTFLSTPPSRVATALRCQAAEHLLSFYPRHPRGWRLGQSSSAGG